MSGQLVDPDGSPISVREVKTLESASTTDLQGRFTIAYNDDAQSVTFHYRERMYRRSYRPVDDGQQLIIRLPQVLPMKVHCGTAPGCDPQLRWDLGEGLTLDVDPGCTGAPSVGLLDVPKSAPEATCRGVGDKVVEASVRDQDRYQHLYLSMGPVPVTVQVEGADLSTCTVHVGRAVAELNDDRWLSSVTREVQVAATCAGRPALPTRVSPTHANAALSWASEGPELELGSWLEGQQVGLQRLSEPAYLIALSPSASGRVLLPPLSAGDYQLLIGDVPVLGARPPREQGASGAVHLHRASGGLVGTLRLQTDVKGGAISVKAPARR